MHGLFERLLQEASPLVRAQALRLEEDLKKKRGEEEDTERTEGREQDRREAKAAARVLRAGRGSVAGGLGVVVLDEFHCVGEKERGYLLECLLMKLIFLNSFLRQDIQLVAMSATLPNAAEVSSAGTRQRGPCHCCCLACADLALSRHRLGLTVPVSTAAVERQHL